MAASAAATTVTEAAPSAAATLPPTPAGSTEESTLGELAKTYAGTLASMLLNGRPAVKQNKEGKWACMICRRQFAQEDLLRKHVEKSPLHMTNFEKMRSEKKLSVKPVGSIKGAVVGPGTGIVYRNRAQERRNLHGQDAMPQTIGPSRNERDEMMIQQQEQRKAELESDALQRQGANKVNEPIQSDNLGFQMMQSSGWSGGGLGKDQAGIVEPVQAQGTRGKMGVGADGGVGGFDSSKIIATNFKDANQKMARARYEAEFNQGGDEKRMKLM